MITPSAASSEQHNHATAVQAAMLRAVLAAETYKRTGVVPGWAKAGGT